MSPKSLVSRLAQQAKDEPSREIYVTYDHEIVRKSITTKELYTMASRFASILRSEGIGRDDVVLISLPQSLELAVVIYGVILNGAVAICNDVAAADDSAVFYHALNKSRAKALVVRSVNGDLTWDEVKDKVEGRAEGNLSAKSKNSKAPTVEKVLLVNRQDAFNPGPGFLNMLKKYPDTYVDSELPPDHVCWLFLTSGTTGMPKIVMKSLRSLVEDPDTGFLETNIVPGKPKMFMNANWNWLIGATVDIFGGWTRVMPDLWIKPKDVYGMFCNIFKKEDVRAAFLTPPEMQGMLELWDQPHIMLDCLLTGGFPITRKLISWMLTISKRLEVRYACSEVLTISQKTITSVDQYKDFDCGHLVKGTKIKVVDSDMKPAPPHTPGRMLLSAPGIFSGYYNDEEKTKEAMTTDGWFLSSDAGYINKEGNLIVIGRHDYIIKHKDHQIYPVTIEKIIANNPAVKTVVVIPIPHDTNHHDICACVVKEPGCDITEQEIIQTVADEVARGTEGIIPPQNVMFYNSIETNARGKMDTKKLIKEVREKLSI